jgi:hypothetical protein
LKDFVEKKKTESRDVSVNKGRTSRHVKLKRENIDPICYLLRLYTSFGFTDEGILCSSNFRLICVYYLHLTNSWNLTNSNLLVRDISMSCGFSTGDIMLHVHVLDIHSLKPHQNTTWRTKESQTRRTPKNCVLSPFLFKIYFNKLYLFFLSICS